MHEAFLVAGSHGTLPAKFLSGTSTVIEKVGLLSYFLFLARTTIRFRIKRNRSLKSDRVNGFRKSTAKRMFLSGFTTNSITQLTNCIQGQK